MAGPRPVFVVRLGVAAAMAGVLILGRPEGLVAGAAWGLLGLCLALELLASVAYLRRRSRHPE